MATYDKLTVTGFFIDVDRETRQVIDAGTSTLEALVSTDYEFSYTVLSNNGGAMPEVDFEDATGTGHLSSINGAPAFSNADTFTYFGNISWGVGRLSQTVSFFAIDQNTQTSREYFFALNGDEFPQIRNLSDWNSLSSSEAEFGPITSGALAPNAKFDVSDLNRVSVTQVDELTGTSGDDDIFGGVGDDQISDGLGDDTIYGGNGDDTLFAGTGVDFFDGGAGVDEVRVTTPSTDEDLSLFFNMVTGVHGAVETTFNRDVYINVENYTVDGDWDTEVTGNASANVIVTDEGDDRVFAGKGNDSVFLGSGNDYVKAGGGAEDFDGGSGKDYISYYDSTNGITANLAEDTISGSWAVNDTIKNFESISGSRTGGDNITGTSGSNTIKTYGGNDKVYAGKGTDKVELGSGNDYVKAGGGKETFDGGSGKDWISYYDSTNGITVNLQTDTISGSWAVNDTIKDFESFSGSKTGDDDVTGTTGSNTIRTYGGDDRVSTLGGTDVVELGSGDDYVRVGGGKESFDGGSGKDYISYYDSSNGIRIDLRDDEVSGSWAVNDTIKDFESASGSKTGNDTMLGTNGANTLRGNGGDDKLYGRGGSDKMYGGDGEDFLDGGGGSGTDLLYGGDDADVFHFDRGEGVDVVKDFENNVDVIELDGFVFPQEVGSDNPFDYATQVGDDVVFDFGSDGMLTVENATIGQLGNDLEMV